MLIYNCSTQHVKGIHIKYWVVYKTVIWRKLSKQKKSDNFSYFIQDEFFPSCTIFKQRQYNKLCGEVSSSVSTVTPLTKAFFD